MANTYKKVHLHIVFAVKNREALLKKPWSSDLYSYLAGTINSRGHYSLAVNGYKDHVHKLLDYNLKELIPDLVRELKKASSKYIRENNLSPFRFEWQTGYGVFSVGWKDLDKVIKYIANQEKHHSNQETFRDEYMSMLKSYAVKYDNEYVFEFWNDI